MALDLPALCLGGNVFGWTADRETSFAVLDAARAAGLTFVDTADVYSAWAHDGVGGQSEEIVGAWMADRGCRDEVLLATKAGMHPGLDDLRPRTLRRALEGSLHRLGVDRIDLFYLHRDDGGDLRETLIELDAMVRTGTVAALGLSNFDASRVREAAEICAADGLVAPQVLQPEWSLMERGFEDAERDAAAEAGLAVVPYSALASGFLTGKYRPGGPDSGSSRAGKASRYLDEPRGPAVLDALDVAARRHGVEPTTVALAWLRAQPHCAAPIASARTPEQVAPLAASASLELDEDSLRRLDVASRR